MKIESLINILSEEFSGFEGLIAVLRDKRDAIEKSDVQRLRKLLEKEKENLNYLDELEKKRIDVVESVSKSLSIKPTIFDIINAIDEPYRHDLAMVVAKLTNLVNEVSLVNLGIQRMIIYRLEEFDFIMDIFKGQDKTYDQTGHVPDGIIFNGRA
jgi:hypothetical protein